MSTVSPEKLHPLHVVIAIGAIILGSLLALNYSDRAIAADGNAMCSQKKNECDTKAKKDKKDPPKECKKKIEAIKCQVSQCIGNCEYGKGECKGNPSTCPQGKSNTNPQKEKEEKPKEEKGEGGKPPEMPKIPEMPKKEPKSEEKKNEDCLAQGKTQEQCDKENKGIFDRASSAFNDIWKNLTGQSGEPEVRLDDSAKKILDSLNTPEATGGTGEDTGKKTGAEPTTPTGPKGTTNEPNPLEQQRAGKSAPPQGHSKGGGAANTFGPEGNPQPPAQNATIQTLIDRIRDLFRQLFGF